jgi:hypothetical protein
VAVVAADFRAVNGRVRFDDVVDVGEGDEGVGGEEADGGGVEVVEAIVSRWGVWSKGGEDGPLILPKSGLLRDELRDHARACACCEVMVWNSI